MKRKTNIPKVLTVLSIGCICLIFFSCGKKNGKQSKIIDEKVTIKTTERKNTTKSKTEKNLTGKEEKQMLLSKLDKRVSKFDKTLINTINFEKWKSGNYNVKFNPENIKVTNRNQVIDWIIRISKVPVTKETYSTLINVYSNLYEQCPTPAERIELLGLMGETAKKMYDYNAALVYLLNDNGDYNESDYAKRLYEDNLALAADIYSEYLDYDNIKKLGEKLKSCKNNSARFAYYSSLIKAYAYQGYEDEARIVAKEGCENFNNNPNKVEKLNRLLELYLSYQPITPEFARIRIETINRKISGKQTTMDKLIEAGTNLLRNNPIK